MVWVEGVKFSCLPCIKGHRSANCTHPNRPLTEIKKKGRPVTHCSTCRPLRRACGITAKCICPAPAAAPSAPVCHTLPASSGLEPYSVPSRVLLHGSIDEEAVDSLKSSEDEQHLQGLPPDASALLASINSTNDVASSSVPLDGGFLGAFVTPTLAMDYQLPSSNYSSSSSSASSMPSTTPLDDQSCSPLLSASLEEMLAAALQNDTEASRGVVSEWDGLWNSTFDGDAAATALDHWSSLGLDFSAVDLGASSGTSSSSYSHENEHEYDYEYGWNGTLLELEREREAQRQRDEVLLYENVF